MLVDVEKLAAARYDQAQTARGFIIIRTERHSRLYGEATKLFAETLARTREDALASPDPDAAAAAVAKLADAAADWQREIGDPEVNLTRDPATADKAIEVAKSARNSELMQKFRDALQNARTVAHDGAGGKARRREHSRSPSCAMRRSSARSWRWPARRRSPGALHGAIAKPISGMTAAMRRLAAGETELDVPAQGRGDEVGSMAAAVEVFRVAAIDKLKLDAEAEAARRALDAERAAREARDADQRRQLQQAVATLGAGLSRLAAKDLTYRVSADLPESYRRLQADFNTAISQLEQALASVSGATDVIHSGSREISTAADDLSRRAEQQAASLEETAAAINEIAATMRTAAEGAEHAHQLVGAARNDAAQDRSGRDQGRRGDGRHQDLVGADRPDHRRHRRDRVPDQPAGAQRRGRGGARRRRRPRLRRRRRRGAGARPALGPGRQGDQGAHLHLRGAGARRAWRWSAKPARRCSASSPRSTTSIRWWRRSRSAPRSSRAASTRSIPPSATWIR